MEWPASAKRDGASARMRRAMAPILSSRMWLATVTGPNRQSAGTTGAKTRGEETRPGTSRIGIVSSMRRSPGNFWQQNGAVGELQIKTTELAVKYPQNRV